MPQIAQLPEIWSSQLFWLLIIFGLVYVVVGKTMLPKVMDTVGLRDQQIAFAMGEALAHLRYLEGVGALIRTSENGRDLYLVAR